MRISIKKLSKYIILYSVVSVIVIYFSASPLLHMFTKNAAGHVGVVRQMTPSNLTAGRSIESKKRANTLLPARTVSSVSSESKAVNLTNSSKTDSFFRQVGEMPVWVYAVHYDHVSAEAGRALLKGFGLTDKQRRIFCHMTEAGHVTVVSSEITVMNNGHENTYPPMTFVCHLKASAHPDTVGLTFSETETPTHQYPVQYPGPRVRNFTVCFSILFGPFHFHSQLITALEFNQLLGAEHFFIYNESIDASTDEVIRHYQSKGLVTVMPWPVPTGKTFYHGQTAAINDCVYRNRNASKFVLIQDTDEIIMPQQRSTWAELCHDVERTFYSTVKNNPKTGKTPLLGSMYIRSSMFDSKTIVKNLGNFSVHPEEENLFKTIGIAPMTRVLRSNPPFPFPSKSKVIIHPDRVVESAIHVTRTHVSGATYSVVPPNVAIVNHYRYKKPSMNDTVDTQAMRFHNKLYKRLLVSIKKLPNVFKNYAPGPKKQGIVSLSHKMTAVQKKQ